MKINEITMDDVIAWLAEHDQAWEDFCEYFGIDEDETETREMS